MKFDGRSVFWIVLLWAAVLRLGAATNGLPLSLVSDEEVMIGGTLRMLETRNPFPSLSAILAETLYYPPFVAWIYLVAFAPIVGFVWLSIGLAPVVDLGLALSFQPEPLWFVARAVSVGFGMASLAVVYNLAREIGLGVAASVLAVALVAFEPTHLMMTAVARHWAPTIFFIWATLLMAVRVLRHGRASDYRWAALLGGLGFGTSYIGALGLVGLAVAHLVRVAQRREWRALIGAEAIQTLAIACPLIAFFAAAHVPAIARMLGAGTPLPLGETKSFAAFFDACAFYFGSYLRSNPILTTVGLACLAASAAMPGPQRRYATAGIVACAFFMAFLYAFMPIEERYAVPLVVFLGLGAACVLDRLPNGRIRVLIAAAMLGYPIATSVQLALLMAAPDTRLEAKRWIEATVRADDGVGVDAPGIWFRNTPRAVAAIGAIDPGALRNRDRQILALGDRSTPVRLPPPVAYADMAQIRSLAWQNAQKTQLQFLYSQGWRYAVLASGIDAAVAPWHADVAACSNLVVQFEGSPPPLRTLDMRRTEIFREPSATWFRRDSFGPRVVIFELQGPGDMSDACRAKIGQ